MRSTWYVHAFTHVCIYKFFVNNQLESVLSIFPTFFLQELETVESAYQANSEASTSDCCFVAENSRVVCEQQVLCTVPVLFTACLCILLLFQFEVPFSCQECVFYVLAHPCRLQQKVAYIGVVSYINHNLYMSYKLLFSLDTIMYGFSPYFSYILWHCITLCATIVLIWQLFSSCFRSCMKDYCHHTVFMCTWSSIIQGVFTTPWLDLHGHLLATQP